MENPCERETGLCVFIRFKIRYLIHSRIVRLHASFIYTLVHIVYKIKVQ